MAEAKKTAAKSGGAPKRKPGRKLGALYTISGEKAVRKNKFCPKCGAGTFMAAHSNRVVCGKCHYVEFVKRM